MVMANRRVSRHMREKLKAELHRLQRLQVMEKKTKPTSWLSQLVMAPKKDGSDSMRIDPCELSEVLQRDRYIMPVFLKTLFMNCEMRNASRKLTYLPDTGM